MLLLLHYSDYTVAVFLSELKYFKYCIKITLINFHYLTIIGRFL